MQKVLTRVWVRDGLMLDGERLFLAAWELMTDYKINDALLGFGKPAIDSLFLDAEGRMVALELKPSVLAPREAWAVLCQVSHRAYRLAEEYKPECLDRAYIACHSGLHGRVPVDEAVQPLWEAHAEFLDITALTNPVPLPVRRMVAAREFGEPWERICSTFTHAPREQIVQELSRYSTRGGAAREFNRWRALPEAISGVGPGVSWTTVSVGGRP